MLWSRLLVDGQFYFIERGRLPQSCTTIPNPHRMSRSSCLVWYEHLRDNTAERFQFRRVIRDSGELIATYDTLCIHRHPQSKLDWPAEAKLYAKIIDGHQSSSQTLCAWKSLPLARTDGVYIPLKPATINTLTAIGGDRVNLQQLGDRIVRLEAVGPAHVSS